MSDLIKYMDMLPDTPLKAQIRRLADAALRNKEFGLVYDPCAPEKVVIDGKEQVLGDTIYPGLELVGADNWVDNWVDNWGEAVDAMNAHILIEAENYQTLSAATVVVAQAGKIILLAPARKRRPRVFSIGSAN